MAMTLVAVNPTADQVNVPVSSNLLLRIDEAVHSVVDASVVVRLRLSPTEVALVYDGSAGGFQSGYQGGSSSYSNTPGVGVAITVDPDPDQLFETLVYTVEVEADNDNAEHLSDSYSFDTAQVGKVKNSGFEAPHTSAAGQARYWTDIGFDPGSQMGVKRGKVNSPAIYTPPEGEHVLVLGSTDLTEALDAIPSPVLQPNLGFGSSGTVDRFTGQLAIPEGHFITGVEIRKNGTTKVGADDGKGWVIDDGTGYAIKGGINYWTGAYWLEEDSGQVWDLFDTLDILVQTMPLAFQHVLEQDIRDQNLTGVEFLRFNYKWAAPSTINTNVVWRLRVLFDGAVVWQKDLSPTDVGTSEESLSVSLLSVSGGGHRFEFLLSLETTAILFTKFDGVWLTETFESWRNSSSQFFEGVSEQADFDNASSTTETFDAWRNSSSQFDEGTAEQATFDNGASLVETMENWRD